MHLPSGRPNKPAARLGSEDVCRQRSQGGEEDRRGRHEEKSALTMRLPADAGGEGWAVHTSPRVYSFQRRAENRQSKRRSGRQTDKRYINNAGDSGDCRRWWCMNSQFPKVCGVFSLSSGGRVLASNVPEWSVMSGALDSSDLTANQASMPLGVDPREGPGSRPDPILLPACVPKRERRPGARQPERE